MITHARTGAARFLGYKIAVQHDNSMVCRGRRSVNGALRRQKSARVIDSQPIRVDYPHKEILTRLLADTCELCGNKDSVEVHHIRTLAELGIPGPLAPQWVTAMANRRRKTAPQ